MNVEITLVSRQTIDGETQEEVTTAAGTWCTCEGGGVLTYATTEDGQTDTTRLIVEDKQVTVAREGSCHSRLILEVGQTHLCPYETPYGTFSLGVTATAIDVKMAPTGGNIQLTYTLDMGGAAAHNTIEITIKEVS